MPKRHTTANRSISSVRASRDGHSFHDIWAARIALRLVNDRTTLTAVAMEGFSPGGTAAIAGEEIADVVLYHGAPTLEDATQVEVIQLKFSTARTTRPLPLSEIAPTLAKFAEVYRDHKPADRAKLSFELVCNRPVSPRLAAPLSTSTRSTSTSTGTTAQLRSLTKLSARQFADFAARLQITTQANSLNKVGHDIRRTIAAWSPPGSPTVRPRYLELVQLLHDKAGTAGADNNLVTRTDVLAALDVEHEHDVLPCPAQFPAVPECLERSLLADLQRACSTATLPLLLHAEAGVGKTVTMQLLAARLAVTDLVVLFDGFAGGAWRDPADARHLPRRAIVHIANTLACDHGVCDLLLPTSAEDDQLISALRTRLAQAVVSLRATRTNARVVLMLDAIDHAGEAARAATNERSYARLLLQSLAASPIDGVIVVASCRSERRELARGSVRCVEFELPPLTAGEAAELAALRGVDDRAVAALLHARSAGNPRVLDALIDERKHTKPAPASRAVAVVDLDTIIARRLEKAIAETERRASGSNARILLTALSLLPPPVPVTELSALYGHVPQAVTSLVTDLFPLLDLTSLGIMFRDEPTETFVRKRYRANSADVASVATALTQAQDRSSYAARVLPQLLAELGKIDELVALAFDERVPRPTVKAAIARVEESQVRLSRVTAALRACVERRRHADLLPLMVEAARLSGGTARADQFLLDNPDLVAVSGDRSIHRRLEELRGYAPARRHSALAIAYALIGDRAEARRHATRNWEWLQQPPRDYRSLDEQRDNDPNSRTYAATLLDAVIGGNAKGVTRWLAHVAGQSPEDAFGYTAALVDLLALTARTTAEPAALSSYVTAALGAGTHALPSLVPCISHFGMLDDKLRRRLARRLASLVQETSPVREQRGWQDGHLPHYQTALLRAAIHAVMRGDNATALNLVRIANIGRPVSHRYRSEHRYDPVCDLVLAAAVEVAARGRQACLRDIAPSDLDAVVAPQCPTDDPAQYDVVVDSVLKEPAQEPSSTSSNKLTREQRRELGEVIAHRVRPLLPIVDALATLIGASAGKADRMTAAVGTIEAAIPDGAGYPYRDDASYFGRVGTEALLTIADTLGALDLQSATAISTIIQHHPFFFIPFKTRFVAACAAAPETVPLAVRSALQITEQIKTLDDVPGVIGAYAALARALLPGSLAEAQAYIAKAFDAVDGLGSTDTETVMALVRLSVHTPHALSPRAAHAFHRICELGFGDEPGKFIWTTMGRALARTAGLASLVQAARWDHRGVADLEHSGPPLITALVEQGHLAPDVAGALIGIDEPHGSWGWSLAAFASATMPLVDISRQKQVAAYIVTEFERTNVRFSDSDDVKKLRDVLAPHLPAGSPSLARLRGLTTALQVDAPSMAPLRVFRDPEIAEIIAGLDPLDATAIDRTLHAWRETHELQAISLHGLITTLAERVANIDDRLRFLRVVIELEQPLEDKLTPFLHLAETWSAGSLAAARQLPGLLTNIVRRHAVELVNSPYSLDYRLDRLRSLGLPRLDVAREVIDVLGRDCIRIPSHAWLTMAETAHADAAPTSITAAIERYVFAGTANLSDDLAGGPWRADLAPPSDPKQLVARLLWMRLGAPHAAARWRAAHAVRRLAELGLHDHVRLVVDLAASSDAPPFAGISTPFFYLHARTWLLIALARLAVQSPETMAPFREWLESHLSGPDRHALNRQLAADALHALLPASPAKRRRSIATLIANATTPPHGCREHDGTYRGDSYTSPPDGQRSPFQFDYEFRKTEINALAALFNMPTWQVERLCAAKIKLHAPGATDASDLGTGSRSSYGTLDDIRHHGSAPRRDIWGTYLSWHAVLETAAELFDTRPMIRRYGPHEDPWMDWLASFSATLPDGSWRADHTSPTPPELLRRLTPSSSQSTCPLPEDPAALAQLLSIVPGSPLPNWLTVKGYWHATTDCTIRVSSSLVSRSLAPVAALAVMSGHPNDRWLPDEGSWGRVPTPLVAWTRDSPDRSIGIDCHDPYASSMAYPMASPSTRFIDLERLASDRLAFVWRRSDEIAFRSTAWGHTSYGAREQSSSEGYRLQCNRDWLLQCLARREASLLILIDATWYRSERSGGSEAQKRQLLVQIETDGTSAAHSDVPAEIADLVAKIPSDMCREFSHRFVEILDAKTDQKPKRSGRSRLRR